MAIVTAQSKIQAECSAFGRVKESTFNPGQQIQSIKFVSTDPHATTSHWATFPVDQAQQFKMGDRVNLLPTTRKGKSTFDIERSEYLARAVNAVGGQCYINAYLALWVPGFSHCDYVQGFAVGDSAPPIEHCWLQESGKILDPTILSLGTDYTYYPAEVFDVACREEAEELLTCPVVTATLTSELRSSEGLPFASLLIEEPCDFDSELFVAFLGDQTIQLAGETYMKAWQAAWRNFDGRTPEIGPKEFRRRWITAYT